MREIRVGVSSSVEKRALIVSTSDLKAVSSDSGRTLTSNIAAGSIHVAAVEP
jgi:hypothetical protein